MSNAIVQFDFNELSQVAKAMAASGFFQDTKLEAQAIVKVLAGREMGLGPFASMTGIHIIQGRPSLGANLIASLIKNDPRYNYRVVQLDDKACSIDFYENGEKCGNSTFTAEDARKAQTKNLDKFPKNMLFARAISNGAKWFTPGIFGGSPVYTPEELGADVDEEGNIIEGQFTQTTPVEVHDPAQKAKDLSKPAAWPKIWLQTLTSKNYASNEFDAAGMLAKSSVIRPETPITPAHVGGYGKHYRAKRDEGATSEVAAEHADKKLKDYMEGEKKPAPVIVDERPDIGDGWDGSEQD